MSEPKEIKLSIFEPLNEYFQLLCLECPSGDFVSGCNKDLMKLLTYECDPNRTSADKSSEISKNFLEALEQFAFNLKTADKPLSKITIKGALYKVFEKVFQKYAEDSNPANKSKSFSDLTVGDIPSYDLDKIAKSISDEVKKDSECKKVGFTMENGVTETQPSETYLFKFKTKFNELTRATSTDILMTKLRELFNGWLTESFDDVYGESNTYFNYIFLSVNLCGFSKLLC